MESVRNRTFFPAYRQGNSRKGNHKGSLWKSRYRKLFCRFPTLISAVFGAFGNVAGTGNQNRPETLLAIMYAFPAEGVKGDAAMVVEKERPFQLS